MLLGIYFHIAIFHYSESLLGLIAMSTHYFRMHAFFLISGFFSALVLYRKGHYEMLNNRFTRIFLPLIIMVWPIWILNNFTSKFNELRYEKNILESLIQSFSKFFTNPWENFIPWDTGHLWFLSLLFGMSLLSYLMRNRLSNNYILKLSQRSVLLIFDRPWIGMLIFCSSYSLLLLVLNKFEAQGEGGWSSWIWFFKGNGIKTFIAFSFFYFIGWQMYHYRDKIIDLSVRQYLKIWFFLSILINIPLYSLYSAGYNNPIPWMNEVHRNRYNLNENLQKQKVTFMIDMSGEIVVEGSGDTASVYVCVAELGNPSGIKMKDIGNGIWSASVDLNPGIYHYKFRNGFHIDWEGEPSGWEVGDQIGKGGCGYGQYNNRKFKLKDKDITLGVFCWSDCTDCFGNEIPAAFYEKDFETVIVERVFIFLLNFLVPAYIMLVLALFIRFCSKPSKRLKYVSDSAYWIYIIHLPLTFFIPAFFHQSEINMFLKFIISSFIVTVICFLTYHYFVRKTFIGKFLNGKKYK